MADGMKFQELCDEVYAEYDKIMSSHQRDIMELPVVAIVRTPSNTVHKLEVTGWRLGSRSIELISEQGDSNATSEEASSEVTSEVYEWKEYIPPDLQAARERYRQEYPQGTSPPE